MKVSPQTFSNSCAVHVPLLRALQERVGELSEADARRLIRDSGKADDELPETTWRRLKELQILVPTEPASDFYLLAEPVGRLLAYLLDEAKAATPEIIRGYIQSLEALGKQLSRAIDTDNLTVVRLALEKIQQTLRRIYADLDETHHAIRLHLPADLHQRFAHHANRSLLDKPNSRAILANLRRTSSGDIRQVLALIDHHNAGLEQEALLV
jgi:hypothetical protein